jgi:hypothetical protein
VNVTQKVVILFWIIAIVVLTVLPPWTVHTTAYYTPGAVSDWGTKTMFRSFLATPEWEIYSYPSEPSTLKLSGKLRFDLLALELFVASVVMAGLLFVVARRKQL